jgi:hypothetical protein
VLSTAAIFGRHFDWRLVSQAVDEPSSVVSSAFERGVQHQLLVVRDGAFFFRHALTREAVLERLLPPRRRTLATAALATVDAAHPTWPLTLTWMSRGGILPPILHFSQETNTGRPSC